MNMNEATTGRLYDIWSVIYDYTFGALVRTRQTRAIEQLHLQAGDRVLDLGVGTGIMLGNYPRNVTVVGMDLSQGMLEKAEEKRRSQQLRHCHLIRADAMLPPFAPASFDHVMISHVISVVSDPSRLLQWAARLLKPGGRIVVLNHFQSTRPLIAVFEHVLNPLFVKIGWRSNLLLEEALRGVPLQVEYCFKMRLVDLWQIVVLKRPDCRPSSGSASLAAAQAPPLPAGQAL